MRNIVPKALFFLTFLFIAAPAQALTFAFDIFEFAEGDGQVFNIPIEESGIYTMSVTSYSGDPDIYLLDSNDEPLEVSNLVGDDRISTNLSSGTYKIVVNMASCDHYSGSCDTEFSVGKRTESGVDRIDVLNDCANNMQLTLEGTREEALSFCLDNL